MTTKQKLMKLEKINDKTADLLYDEISDYFCHENERCYIRACAMIRALEAANVIEWAAPLLRMIDNADTWKEFKELLQKAVEEAEVEEKLKESW